MPVLTEAQIRQKVELPSTQPDIRRVRYGFYYCGARVVFGPDGGVYLGDPSAHPEDSLGWTACDRYELHPEDDHLVPPIEDIVFPWELAPAHIPLSQTEVGKVYRIYDTEGWRNFHGAIVAFVYPVGCDAYMVCLAPGRGGDSTPFRSTWSITTAQKNDPTFWSGVMFEEVNFQFDGVSV